MNYANLLRDTDSIDSSASWTRTSVTVTRDQPDRDGNANRYYKLVRNGSASSNINAPINLVGTSGIFTFSVDAKADTVAIMRIGIARANNAWAVSKDDDRPLDGTLRRYACTAYGITPGERVRPYLYVGSLNDVATTVSSVIVGELLGNDGPIAKPFVETLTAQAGISVIVPERSLILGAMIIDYGTAAPTTGYHVIGSRRNHSAPAVGQPTGWICTVSGTPGTWVALPNL